MKSLYRFIVTITITLILLAGALYLNRARFIGLIFSSKLGTKVTIDNIYLDKDLITIKGVKISNRFGNEHEMPYAMTIDAIQFKAPLKNYMQRHVEIQNILVYQAIIYIQFTLKDKSQTNWSELIHSFNPDEQSLVDKNRKTYATIERLQIKRIVARIGSIFNQSVDIKSIPDMEFKNINTEKGSVFKKISQTIVGHLVFHVQDILQFPFKVPFEVLKNLLTPKKTTSPLENYDK